MFCVLSQSTWDNVLSSRSSQEIPRETDGYGCEKRTNRKGRSYLSCVRRVHLSKSRFSRSVPSDGASSRQF